MISPGLLDRYMLFGDPIYKRQETDQPDSGLDNMFAPVPGTGKSNGSFGRLSQRSSLYTPDNWPASQSGQGGGRSQRHSGHRCSEAAPQQLDSRNSMVALKHLRRRPACSTCMPRPAG